MGETEYVYSNLLAAFSGFFLLAAFIRHFAPRTPLPGESWLLLSGLFYGLLEPLGDALPPVRLNPELVISLLLPVLVFSAGRHLPMALLMRSTCPLLLLVLLGIPFSMLLIGLPAAWLMDIPYMHGLLLGAAIAAIDPTAIGYILNQFQIPERLRLLLHGEAIFSDAIVIVIFTALAAVLMGSNELSLAGIVVSSSRSMLLAVPVGLLLGWLGGLLVRQWREQNRIPGLTLTLALPLSAYLLSERLLHASGIIAVLCAALAFSYTRHVRVLRDVHGHGGNELYDQFWEFIGSISASFLFFALGAVAAAQVFPLQWMLVGGILVVLISRAVLVYGAGTLLRMQGCSLPWDWRHVIFLGGLRGAVPAALVLMTPVDYVYRDELLAMVFMLVAYSVIIHPLLLRQYLLRHPVAALFTGGEHEPGNGLEGIIEELPSPLARRLEACDWGVAAIAGMLAGVVFIMLEMVMVPLFMGISAWTPVRMIAAIGLGPDALPPPASFVVNIALTAMVVHFTLSLVYAWILVPFIAHVSLIRATLVGMVGGLVIYLVNFYLFTALFPWFADARNWISIFAHLVFGGVLASSYRIFRFGLNPRDGSCAK